MKITQLQDITPSTVSHNSSIEKKLIIGNGEIPHITNFSIATFPPGEAAYSHFHSDMTEVFFVRSGHGQITVDGQDYELPEGACITVEPNEHHELRNVGSSDLEVMYFGVITC